MKIKICGLKNPENIKEICSLNPDFVGFIFYEKSKRYVGEQFEETLVKQISKVIKKVGVFVDEEPNKIIELAQKYDLDYVQLHGDETIAVCQFLQVKKLKIIKAFQMDENFDFSILKLYDNCCDFFLFDTKNSQFGGSGKSFDWSILKNQTIEKPFWLSGGLGLDNINEAMNLKINNLIGLDLNSQLENEFYEKDYNKTKQIINLIR
jgi:phosphoribosylanthranilate isomerase